VDWSFLEKVLLKLGFQSQWVQRIMSCISSVRYTVRFNGVPPASFTPTRGLRQGDPLSPFLFLFVADGLSTLLQKKVQDRSLQELKVCRGAPGISHLLFADDTLLFFKANVEQASLAKQALDLFAQCTGQLINPAKCSIMFNEHGDTMEQDQVKHILEVQLSSFETKYLGLPAPFRSHKKRKIPISHGMTW